MCTFYECHGKFNQLWYYNQRTNQLKSKKNHQCLDLNYNKKNKNLYVHRCHNGWNQKFSFADGEISTAGDGKKYCMDLDTRNGAKNNVYANSNCKDSTDQKVRFTQVDTENLYELDLGEYVWPNKQKEYSILYACMHDETRTMVKKGEVKRSDTKDWQKMRVHIKCDDPYYPIPTAGILYNDGENGEPLGDQYFSYS